MASLRDDLGGVVEGAELEREVSPVVGGEIDLHLDRLAHHVPPADDTVAELAAGLVLPWLCVEIRAVSIPQN